MSRISQQQLESYLWGAATLLRGTIDAGDYKQFIFPLLFYKRLCDVYDEETKNALIESEGDKDFAAYPENHRFQIPPEAHWNETRKVAKNVGAALQNSLRAIETANPNKLYGIFGDAQWTNKDRLPDAMLRDLIEHFSSLELTIANLPEDELGNGYEYLIKKFADDAGHTAAEFYTNRTVVHLMTELLQPQPGESVYDPTCGSGGMPLSCIAHLRRQGKEWRNVSIYGQERNLMTSSIARMNCFLHGIEDFRIERGDTLAEPKFVQGDRLQQFDVVLANPPYSIRQWDREAFASDPWGRNILGTPPQGRADYAFWQHIIQSMNPLTGRCAILFPHGVLFRQEEAEMRHKLIEADLIECVIGLGPNLFYNSPMEACVVICRMVKPEKRRNKVLFINAVGEVTRERSQSFLTEEHIEHILRAYKHYQDEPGFTHTASIEEIRSKDGILSIPLYVEANILEKGGACQGTSLPVAIDGWLVSRKAVAESMANIMPNIPLTVLDETLNGLESCELFNHSIWQTVSFDAVVQNHNETCEPEVEGIERFIGLEHLEPGSLHIRTWGKVTDGTTFTRRCRPGQVLFGKRRAYQRKVGVAEFDAVVSGDIYVLAPKNDRMLAELLPFLCMSQRFFQYAVETSAGSLSPRTNWSHLAKFEFALPPLDQQKRIAKLLWALDEVIQNYEAMKNACSNWTKSYINELCLNERFPCKPLGDAINAIIPGKSVVGVSEPAGEGQFGVLKVSAIGQDGFIAIENKRLINQDEYIPKFGVKAGDFLLTRCNTLELVGGVCIVPNDFPNLMLCDKTIRLEFDLEKAIPCFIEAVLRSKSLRGQIESVATGTGRAMKNISQDKIRSLTVPLPRISEQTELMKKLAVGADLNSHLERTVEAASRMRMTIINSIMGG